MSEEVKQAETWQALECQCPYCGTIQTVEWVDETVNGLEECQCENCNEKFTYCHPENNYGLAR